MIETAMTTATPIPAIAPVERPFPFVDGANALLDVVVAGTSDITEELDGVEALEVAEAAAVETNLPSAQSKLLCLRIATGATYFHP